MRLQRDKYKGVEITKNVIQDVGLKYWVDNGHFGTLCMATGTGKSRCGVLASRQTINEYNPTLFSQGRKPRILLSVPLEKLRDINWQKEYEEWGERDIWDNNLERTCYASLNKYEGEEFDLVILDEAHHITPNNVEFFFKNKVHRVLSLTATPPEDKEKRGILNILAPTVFLYTLEEAEGDGLVAPFDIYVIKTQLDSVTKNIKAGAGKRTWMQTELEKYTYITTTIDKLRIEKEEKLKSFNLEKWEVNEFKSTLEVERGRKYSNHESFTSYLKTEESYEKRLLAQIMNRKLLIENLPSKTALAQRLIERVHKEGKRTIVFGGSIAQVNLLCGENVFHSGVKTGKKIISAYDRFINEELDILGVVKALNEGHNIPNVDQAIVVQLNSKELDFIQRLGRIIRKRLGHTAKMFIIVCEGTQDESWFKSALKSFNKGRIRYFDSKQF